MKKLLCILLGLFPWSCGTPQVIQTIKKEISSCPDEVDGIVLHKMYRQFGGYDGVPNYLKIWLSKNYEPSFWDPVFDKWQKKIDDTRKWSGSLEDRCVRQAYSRWLDYYQRELESARRELVTQAEKKSMDSYYSKNDEDRERREEYEKKHEIPSPPR